MIRNAKRHHIIKNLETSSSSSVWKFLGTFKTTIGVDGVNYVFARLLVLVSFGDIKKVILSIRSNAVGCVDISHRMIVTIIDHILPAIFPSCNTFPSLLRQAFIIPLPKRSNPSLSEHFRPMFILPFLSKVLKVCITVSFLVVIIRVQTWPPYNHRCPQGNWRY